MNTNGKLNTGPIADVLRVLPRTELLRLADSCGVPIPRAATRPQIVAALVPDDWVAERTWTTVVAPQELVGTAEAARLLGVERPRIGRWIHRGEMPMPVVKLASGPVWQRRDIEAMRESVEARKRQPSAA